MPLQQQQQRRYLLAVKNPQSLSSSPGVRRRDFWVAKKLLLSLLAASSAGLGPVTATHVRVAFGSCNKQDHDQGYWKVISERKPDIWLWGGDNIYGDTIGPLFPPHRKGTNILPPGVEEKSDETYSCIGGLLCFTSATPEHLRALYAFQNSSTAYQGLMNSVTKMLGIWDDHDMGVNDGDGRFKWLEESKQAMLDFLGDAPDSPRRTQNGVYMSWMTDAPKGQKIAFHLLDNRHNKSPYSDPDGDFLGEEQWAWFEKSLREAKDEAAVNVVLSGIQVYRPWPRGGEVWRRFPKAHQRLLKTLAESRVKGLILLSGDVHMAQLNGLQCGNTLIPELTSSGLTHSVRDLFFVAKWVVRWVLWIWPQDHLMAPTWLGRNFGELDIDIDDNGSAKVKGRIFSLHPGKFFGSPVIEQDFEGLSDGSLLDVSQCEPFQGREPKSSMYRRAGCSVIVLFAFLYFAFKAARRALRNLKQKRQAAKPKQT